MGEWAVTGVVGLGGLGIGLVFGAVAQRTNFCTMGGISDQLLMGDGRRLRTWLLATAVAVIGTQALASGGAVAIDKSIYLTANFGWAGAILGGLLFGFGMTQAGGCGSRTLVRLGAGNLKALVVALVLGLVAYMTLRGLIAPLRVQLEAATNLDLKALGLKTQHLGDMIGLGFGLAAETARRAVAVVAAAGLLWFCFKDADFRSSPRDVFAGLVIGLCSVAGWTVTGILGADDFNPVPLVSVTLVAPVGEGLQYLMTFTGATISFGVAVAGGIVLGSFLAAISGGSFRLEGFADRADLLRHLGGGALMGLGGVLALGCTIGQGVTGMGTLAAGSLLALGSILAGGAIGVKYLEEGSLGGALRALAARN
ncbi:MAG: YeeE/YedE family protein [Alphaproteobacteria bacterium]|nr:YeeE/YedE family protein [Alphaproteobacteria bacterium]